MALGRSDTAPRALGCAGGRDERLPKTYSEGCGNARVLREVLFRYEVVLSRQHVAFECVRSEVLKPLLRVPYLPSAILRVVRTAEGRLMTAHVKCGDLASNVLCKDNVLPPRARHGRAGPSRVRTDTSLLTHDPC